MKKLLLAVSALALITTAHARDLSDCDAPPYGSTGNYEAFIQRAKDLKLTDMDQTVRKMCIAQVRPGEYRDILRANGFTDKEIMEDDPVELTIKFMAIIAEDGQRARGEQP